MNGKIPEAKNGKVTKGKSFAEGMARDVPAWRKMGVCLAMERAICYNKKVRFVRKIAAAADGTGRGRQTGNFGAEAFRRGLEGFF